MSLRRLQAFIECMDIQKAEIMSKPIIFDGENNREMTDTEFSQWQSDRLEAQSKAQIESTKKATRAAAIAKLGLTADEVAALFG